MSTEGVRVLFRGLPSEADNEAGEVRVVLEVGETVGVEPLREVGRPDEVLGAAEDVGVDDVNAAVLHRGDARPPRPLDERRPDCTECLRIVPRVSADGQTLPGQFDDDLRVRKEDCLGVDGWVLPG